MSNVNAIPVLSKTFLCNRSHLKEGQARGFDPWHTGRDTVIALLWKGDVRVFRNNCPHFDVPMQYRKDRFMSGDGQHIVCFAHGALFEPSNGRCVLGPCLGQALTAMNLMVDENADIWLTREHGFKHSDIRAESSHDQLR